MKNINLVPKKEKKNILNKITELFADKKRRYIYLVLFALPFIIAIVIFSIVAIKDAKDLISLLKGQSTVNEAYIIRSMNYVLRDNATDVQQEYFAQLKQAIEVDDASDETISGLICKNYIADLYTWTNKQGQYDVSALYYVYTPQKSIIYTQCRDSFYKYLNNYINDYGQNNLIEVENIEVTKASPLDYPYISAEEEVFEDCIYVTCTWTYKTGSKMDTSKFANSMNFIVGVREGRYEIFEASESPIDAKQEIIEETDDVEIEDED